MLNSLQNHHLGKLRAKQYILGVCTIKCRLEPIVLWFVVNLEGVGKSLRFPFIVSADKNNGNIEVDCKCLTLKYYIMKKFIFLVMTTFTLALWSCGKYNDIPGNEGELSEDLIVSVEIEQIEQYMMSFRIDSTNAEKISYVVIEYSEEVPSASFVLLNGESVPIDSKEPVVVTDLSSFTCYKLLIAAEGAGKTTMINPITFRTKAEGYITFRSTISSISAAESKDGVVSTIELPIQCVSFEDITASVNFATTDTAYAEDVRAKEGTDYIVKSVTTYNLDATKNRINEVTTDLTVAGVERVINFDAEHCYATLVIETIDNYTKDGNKKFDVVLTTANGCSLTSYNRIAIIIADDENPLSQLFGTYTATAVSASNGFPPNVNWEVTITADDETEDKIWIHPICLFGGLSAHDIYPVYATVDLAQGIIQMPYGQCLYGGNNHKYNLVTAGLGDEPILSGENIATLTMGDEVVIEWQSDLGVGNTNANEWWYQAIKEIVFTKK